MIKDIFFKRLIILTIAICTLFLLWKIRIVIVYVIFASLMSLILSPLKKQIQKFIFIKNITISNILSTIITFSIIIILFLLFITNAVNPILDNLKQISISDIDNVIAIMKTFISEKFNNYKIYDTIDHFLSDYKDNLISNFIPNIINNTIGLFPKFIMGAIIIFFISFFFMTTPNMIENIIYSSTGEIYSTKILSVLSSIRKMIRMYVYGVIIQLSIIIILYSTLMYFAGLKGAFAFSFLIAIFNLIPYLGPLIGTGLTAFFCISTNLNLEYSLLLSKLTFVLINFLIVQLIDGIINQPIIFSKVVKAHPLEIFLVIISSSYLVGISGMIFAVPSYAVLRIIAREFFSKFKLIQFITRNIKY